MSTQNKMIYNN